MPVLQINLDPSGNPDFDALDFVGCAGFFYGADNHTLDTFQASLHAASLGETDYTSHSVGFWKSTDAGNEMWRINSNIHKANVGDTSTPSSIITNNAIFGLRNGFTQTNHVSTINRTCTGVVFSNPDQGAYQGGIVLAGDGLNAKIVRLDLDSGGGDVVVTGLGFQPGFLAIITNFPVTDPFQGGNPNLGTAIFGYWNTLGVCDADLNQWNIAEYAEYQSAEAAAVRYLGYTRFTSDMFSVGIDESGVTHEVSVQSIDVDGFTLNMDTPPALDLHCVVLALADPDGFFSVGIDAQTSDGDQSITGLPDQPEFVFFGTASQIDDTVTNTIATSYGSGDGNSQMSSFTGSAGTPPTARQSQTRQDAVIQMAAGDGTVNGYAALSSLDADGFTVNWSSSDGTARLYGWVAGKLSGYTIPTTTILPATDITVNSAVLNGEIDVGPINDTVAHPVVFYYQYGETVYGPLWVDTTHLPVEGTGTVPIPVYVPGLHQCSEHQFNLFVTKDGCPYDAIGTEIFRTGGCGAGQIYRVVLLPMS